MASRARLGRVADGFRPHRDAVVALHHSPKPARHVRLRLQCDHSCPQGGKRDRPVAQVGPDVEREVARPHERTIQLAQVSLPSRTPVRGERTDQSNPCVTTDQSWSMVVDLRHPCGDGSLYAWTNQSLKTAMVGVRWSGFGRAPGSNPQSRNGLNEFGVAADHVDRNRPAGVLAGDERRRLVVPDDDE